MLPSFHDPSLLKTALTHRSVVNEESGKISNERLEFLGDAVLELATTNFLYHQLPNAQEGLMTSYRASLVKTTTLATAATALELGEQLSMSKGEEHSGGRKNTSLLANTFEAVLGALYLDQGFTACYAFLEDHLFPMFDEIMRLNLHKDYKTTLQELVQARGEPTPTYTTQQASGPEHDRTFIVGVSVGETLLGSGSGKSKQEASQEAAKRALEKIQPS